MRICLIEADLILLIKMAIVKPLFSSYSTPLLIPQPHRSRSICQACRTTRARMPSIPLLTPQQWSSLS